MALLVFLLFLGYQLFPFPRESGVHFVRAFQRVGPVNQLSKKGKSTPTASSKLSGPVGIALYGERVFVSDSGNNRIVVFNREGAYLYQFGREGSGLGELDRPMHLAVSKKKLYVAEFGNDRIQEFSLEGRPLTAIGKSGSSPGAFDAPGGVAVDGKGRLYVADFYNHRVEVLSSSGEFLFQLGETKKSGTAPGQFNYPTDVSLFPSGQVLVADAYNHRLQVFSPSGEYLSRFGSFWGLLRIPAPFRGWFSVATGVALDKHGNIYVADFYNSRIQKFTSKGRFLTSFGKGALHHPTDLAIAEDGRVYVADFGRDRVALFEK